MTKKSLLKLEGNDLGSINAEQYIEGNNRNQGIVLMGASFCEGSCELSMKRLTMFGDTAAKGIRISL